MAGDHKRDWEDLAALDPYWAILSEPARRFGNWDVDAFFKTGEVEFNRFMESADRLGYPQERTRALDFGCGVGRVTRAMSRYFEEAVGVDIAESMVSQAKELNRGFPRCRFHSWSGETLDLFPKNHFDLVYCDIVLQHLPSRALIEGKISEFVRVLRPDGLAMFQLLSFIPLKYRLQPIRRAYGILRSLGFDHELLYKRLKLTPIRSNYIRQERVLELLQTLGARTLETRRSTMLDTGVRSSTYLVTK
jgi:ubiquinone/menaquinone biosynthesis C-methylase UbiE